MSLQSRSLEAPRRILVVAGCLLAVDVGGGIFLDFGGSFLFSLLFSFLLAFTVKLLPKAFGILREALYGRKEEDEAHTRCGLYVKTGGRVRAIKNQEGVLYSNHRARCF